MHHGHLIWREDTQDFGGVEARKAELRRLLEEEAEAGWGSPRRRGGSAHISRVRELSESKSHAVTDGSSELHPSPGDIATSLLLPDRTAVTVTGRPEGEWAKVTWRGKTGWMKVDSLRLCSPPRSRGHDYLHARHGEGWRRKGTHSEDVLLQPHPESSSPRFPDGRFWLYDSFKLMKGHIDRILAGVTSDVTQTLAYRLIRSKLDRMLRKGQREVSDRFGVLLDIITTNSLILTGIPHELGNAAYQYTERAHYQKTGLKFVFIGITDNVNCRAARDVFCRDHVRFDAQDQPMPQEPKRSFDALDNQHMYCVFPAPASADFAGDDVRCIGDRTLRQGVYVMPKRTIPHPYKATTISTMRSLHSQRRAAIRAKDWQKVNELNEQLQGARYADEQGSERRVASTIPAPSPATVATPAAQRPHSAPTFITDSHMDVSEVAEMMVKDPVAVYGEGGLLSTVGRSLGDPVALYKTMAAAKSLVQSSATSRVSLPAMHDTAFQRDRVTIVHSPQQVQRLLTTEKAATAILFLASWCTPHQQYLRQWAQAASLYPLIRFLRVNVDTLTEVATNCLVETLPCYQFYFDRDLVCTATPSSPLLLSSPGDSDEDTASFRSALNRVSEILGGRGSPSRIE